MKTVTLNRLINWCLIVFIFSIIACSFERDLRNITMTKKVKLKLNMSLNYHVKNGDYVFSIHDSIGTKLIERFIAFQDSSDFKKDTVDLRYINPYWINKAVKRVLRECIENNEVRIYSIKQSEYINRIRRTVPKAKYKDIHGYYCYTNLLNGDTILYTFSFDCGTPSF